MIYLILLLAVIGLLCLPRILARKQRCSKCGARASRMVDGMWMCIDHVESWLEENEQ